MAIPSRQIGGSTRTALLWQISKQLEQLICIRSGGCGSTTTTTSTTYIPSTLGCVYYTNYGEVPYTLYAYDVDTNTSTPVVIPTGDQLANFAETHTANRYWKGNQTSFIREWVPTSNPNILQVNRNITVSGIVGSNGNYFTFLEAVDDNHLLTTVFNPSSIDNTLTLLDITSGAVTASEITYLFDIYAPAGLDSFILTSTNKIIAIGRRDVGQFDTNVYFITQYSYPNGVLEVEINLSSTFTYTGERGPQLFESADGKLYIFADSNISGNEFSTIFEINLSTYEITPVWSNLGLYNASINSTVACNTVNLISIECLVYLAANGNIYAYDPISNLSVGILSGNNFGVANTDTKLWTASSASTIAEYDLTFTPGPVTTFNRTINIGSAGQYGSFAINNTTLIIGSVNVSPQSSIYELDITTTTGVRTYKGDVPNGFVILDLMLNTAGKLIVLGVPSGSPTASRIWQYDYATWTLETTVNLFGQFTNGEEYAAGLAEYAGDIYLFARVNSCTTTSTLSGVYLVDTTINTITYTGQQTGFGCTTGASSWLPCNTQSLSTESLCGNEYTFGGGESYPSVRSIVLGSGIGTVQFNFDADNQPDRFILEWNSNVVIDTGYRGSSSYNFGQLNRTDFTSELTGRIDPITLNTYPDFTTYPDDGYPLVISPGLGSTAFLKSLALPDEVTVSVYAPMETTAWTVTVECPNSNLCCQLSDVTIGTQTWTGCNLDVTNYQNGDPIPQVQDPTEWAALTTGAWCYYENDLLNGCTYGKLYNWYAVNDPRGLAPAGYHVPTDTDFTTLYTYLGGEPAAGGALKESGLAHWITPNTGATNTSGFTALPGGVRNVPTGTFNLIGAYGFWWSATDNGVGVYSLQLLYNDGGVVGWGTPYFKTDGHSVRLIKDLPTTTTTTTQAPSGFNTIYTNFEAYPITTSTTTSVIPSGFNTIYTHFESL